MGLFNFFKTKNKISEKDIENMLNKGLYNLKNKFYKEAYDIFLMLYKNEKNTINTFNLLQASIYHEDTYYEEKLFKKLKNNIVDKSLYPVELNGPFVRLYYALALCENERQTDAIDQTDYLLKLIAKHEITGSNYLYAKGIPHVGMIRDLINKVYRHDLEKLKIYKEKLLISVDEESKKELIEHYK